MSDAQNTANNFFNRSEQVITLTYEDLEKPIKFFLRPLMSTEAKAAQQEFFALDKEKQEKQADEQNAKMLALLSVKDPEDLPTFEKTENESTGDAITRFFADNNEMKLLVAKHAVARYNQVTQPQEFFR